MNEYARNQNLSPPYNKPNRAGGLTLVSELQ